MIDRFFCNSFSSRFKRCIKSQQLTFSKVNICVSQCISWVDLIIDYFQLTESNLKTALNKQNLTLRPRVNLLGWSESSFRIFHMM